MRSWFWIGFVGVMLVGLVGFGVTGVALVPVSVALGPCLRDWTSPSSYGERVSPLASATAQVGSGRVRVCYGRPAARGRTIMGGLVPYGRLWRTGANEPTRLYTTIPISVAGIRLAPGRYSLYTVPHPDRWEIRVSRSVLHWGNDISGRVQAREVGRAEVAVERTPALVERFTTRFEPAGERQDLVLEWERARIRIPVVAAVP